MTKIAEKDEHNIVYKQLFYETSFVSDLNQSHNISIMNIFVHYPLQNWLAELAAQRSAYLILTWIL